MTENVDRMTDNVSERDWNGLVNQARSHLIESRGIELSPEVEEAYMSLTPEQSVKYDQVVEASRVQEVEGYGVVGAIMGLFVDTAIVISPRLFEAVPEGWGIPIAVGAPAVLAGVGAYLGSKSEIPCKKLVDVAGEMGFDEPPKEDGHLVRFDKSIPGTSELDQYLSDFMVSYQATKRAIDSVRIYDAEQAEGLEVELEKRFNEAKVSLEAFIGGGTDQIYQIPREISYSPKKTVTETKGLIKRSSTTTVVQPTITLEYAPLYL